MAAIAAQELIAVRVAEFAEGMKFFFGMQQLFLPRLIATSSAGSVGVSTSGADTRVAVEIFSTALTHGEACQGLSVL